MSNFLLLLILFVLASVLLLIVYLIDRVNIIEKVTLKFTGESKLKENSGDGVFGDLTAERLWGAMSGIPTQGWDDETLSEIRPRYEIILQKHAEALFEEGVLDGKEDSIKPPSNTHSVNTLRGSVDSWIPQQYADAIYEVGAQKGKSDETDLQTLKQTLNSTYDTLLNQVNLKATRPISEQLLPLETSPDSNDGNLAIENGDSSNNDEKLDRLADAINEELNMQGESSDSAGMTSASEETSTSGSSNSSGKDSESPSSPPPGRKSEVESPQTTSG